ncbi:sensor histidine kinase [Actinomadura sp. DC4]|uniref:sensor histidine kinase n=1 Tax=Actinomadura sp. DC4 TaxID=3055069 RepID=UPI0025AF13B3|nr:sensor histidine kinase [Actinomadura sp. DC4]MDN3354593.1 sensor histidine kinase [Actinomadura sp. DC4]
MNLSTSYDLERASTPGTWRRAVWSSLGLVYLFVWPLSDLFQHPHTTTRVVLSFLAIGSYAASFVGLILVNNPWTGVIARPIWIMLGVTTVLAIAYPLLFGSAWSALPIYLGIAYAMALPPGWAPRGVAGAAALTLLLCLLAGAPGGTSALLAFEALTIGMLMVAFRTSRILVVQLREARGEVARLAASEERLRISRDLHDLLGHTLSLIVLKSEVATRLADRDLDRSLAEVRDIESVARQALADVREAISGYRQRSLTDELQNSRGVLAAADIELTVTTSGTPLPDQIDGLFGWAVREGVTNIVRHSRARTATITVRREPDAAVLEIVDDGVGGTEAVQGNGLRGLGERVGLSGGTVESGPRADGGHRLTVRAPLETPARHEPAGA